jgi:uncharacterized membrane protein
MMFSEMRILTDLRGYVTPRARSMIIAVLLVFVVGSVLVRFISTPDPNMPPEHGDEDNIVLHLFEVGGILAISLAVIHALGRWTRSEVITFFVSCFLFALLFEDMNIQISGDYSYNDNAWMMVHHTMIAIVLGWCAIVYLVVMIMESSPLTSNWNPVEKGIVGGILGLTIDLGIDATAFAYGLWFWEKGSFFGVPVTNFVGWFGAIFWFVLSTEYLRIRGQNWNEIRRFKLRILSILPDYLGLLIFVGLGFALLHTLGIR